MAVTLMNKGKHEKRTPSDSLDPSRPILSNESDALISRIKEIIGEESVASFSRRCGFRESVIRGYVNDGKRPGVDYLIAIADAGAVTIDWLATGRLPKTRAELNALGKVATPRINADALEAIIEGALKISPNASPTKIAAHSARLYKQVFEEGLITEDGNGPGHFGVAA